MNLDERLSIAFASKLISQVVITLAGEESRLTSDSKANEYNAVKYRLQFYVSQLNKPSWKNINNLFDAMQLNWKEVTVNDDYRDIVYTVYLYGSKFLQDDEGQQ